MDLLKMLKSRSIKRRRVTQRTEAKIVTSDELSYGKRIRDGQHPAVTFCKGKVSSSTLSIHWAY
uniref:Uncharacterized protein n=1 Tax=Oryza rufipogon TaxID=4529 RepID=A0A0E0QHD5_ORYRU